MESDTSSDDIEDTNTNDGEGLYCTPEEKAVAVSLEAVTKQFGGMYTGCSPKIRWTSSGSHRLRRVLFVEQEKPSKWSDKEMYVLVLFLVFHSDGQTWVTHNQSKFWKDAAKFVQDHSKSDKL